ncbi:hypothetical protein [Mesorhizobium muleiense]|uniref:hypothetical protein n=1 Tax=Mesorhizobium muleiense TaxID=1004279 RepID=UPI001428C1F7|nr:hypothetical protein [Mesorhizobium muleiense]MCF6098873.1 hypothetical protein [Mesorhizobium muleiense]
MVIAFFRAAAAFEHLPLAAFWGGILATDRRVTEALAFAVDFSPARGDSPFNLNRARS